MNLLPIDRRTLTNSQDHPVKRSALALAVLVLLTCVGWLVANFKRDSLWYDEALTTFVARDSWAMLWAWCTQVDIQVPLHYVVLRLWTDAAGDSEFALRVLSMFCTLLAIAGIMAAGRQLAPGRGVGVAAAILLCFMPGMLWVAYEVRAYALALALYAWATAFLAIIIRRGFVLRWVLCYSLLMLGAMYTHYTALGGFAAHMLILLILALLQRSGMLARTMIACAVLVGIGFAPWTPVMVTRGTTDRSYYVGNPILPQDSARVLANFKLLSRDDLTDDSMLLIAGYATLVIVGVIVGAISKYSSNHTRRAVLVGLLIVIVPTAAVMLTVYFRPKLAGRYAWAAWIGADLLAALAIVGMAALFARLRRGLYPVFSSILLIGVVVATYAIGERGRPPDSDFRGAFAHICMNGTPDDVIVLRDGTLFPLYEYYGRRAPCDVPRYAIAAPMSLITDVQEALTAAESVELRDTALNQNPPHVWVVAWQGDNLDPQGLANGAFENILRWSAVGLQFGDVRVDQYSAVPPEVNAPVMLSTAVEATPVPDGASLEMLTLMSKSTSLGQTQHTATIGERLVVQTWWRAGSIPNPNLRVSARITSADGGWTYYQVDQPPAGWKYMDDRWSSGELVLGRYEVRINSDVPAGTIAVQVVIYDALDRWQPIVIKVGEVTVIK
jgi:hypothetical protein